MPSHFLDLKKAFHALDVKGQAQVLRELYDFSKDVQAFLESRLLHAVDSEELINAMKKETIDKVFHRPMPKTPDGRNVRAIITRAKKLGAGQRTRMELERLAFMGFVDFLNEYGGGPDSFETMACDHLEAYLDFVQETLKDKQERQDCIEAVRKYIQKKNNMPTDALWETFEMGIKHP